MFRHSKNVFFGTFIIISLIGLFYSRLGVRQRESKTLSVTTCNDQIREFPLDFKPTGGLRGSIPRSDLVDSLKATKPRWKSIKVNNLMHALRFWRASAIFPRDQIDSNYSNGSISGNDMLRMLLDNKVAFEANVQPLPFLYRTSRGISAQAEVAGGGAAHHDQYLKVMGEIGITSKSVITMMDGSSDILENVIKTSLNGFDAEQEIEFTAVAYSRWLPPKRCWTDRFNKIHDFNEIATILINRKYEDTACCGIHNVYAMVNLIRAQERYDIIDSDLLLKLRQRVQQVSRLLERNQQQDGTWLQFWYKSTEVSPETDRGFQQIWATGHHLEWIALAPRDLRPNQSNIVNAARALAKRIPTHTATTISNSYPPFSHAARALSLIEELDPSSVLIEDASYNN